jgi:hypothetical protein
MAMVNLLLRYLNGRSPGKSMKMPGVSSGCPGAPSLGPIESCEQRRPCPGGEFLRWPAGSQVSKKPVIALEEERLISSGRGRSNLFLSGKTLEFGGLRTQGARIWSKGRARSRPEVLLPGWIEGAKMICPAAHQALNTPRSDNSGPARSNPGNGSLPPLVIYIPHRNFLPNIFVNKTT